jgi:uncharacterized membrane protein
MPNPITRTVTGVRVAVRNPRSRNIAGATMATIGVLVILVEVGLHIYAAITHVRYEMDHTALLSGAVVGFVGFYLVDSKSATATANIVVGSGAQIIRAVRGGRRSTDTPVVVPAQREDKP